MKRIHKNLIPTLLIICLLSSCATLFSEKVNVLQRHYQLYGHNRKLRTVPFIADILFPPALVVDFATRAIYKPSTYGCIYPPPTKN